MQKIIIDHKKNDDDYYYSKFVNAIKSKTTKRIIHTDSHILLIF